MCIIVAKPAGVEMPSVDTLRECFFSNPDGSGFMFPEGFVYENGIGVTINKGFMSFDEFMSRLDSEIPEEYRTATPIVMHFRIATHGKVQPKCCHPFPVSSSKEQLWASRSTASVGVAHNGIISGRTTNDNKSDTMDFIMGVMAPLMRIDSDFNTNDDALALLESACGSKLAILDAEGNLTTVGDFIEDNGVLYSNESYRPLQIKNIDWSAYYDDYFGYGAYDDKFLELQAQGASIEELLELLPYEACGICPMREECVCVYPECQNELQAWHNCEEYIDEFGEYEDIAEVS